MKKSPSSFSPLSDLLRKELGKLAPKTFSTTINLGKHWRDAVGDAVAENARVLYCRNQILHVGVRNSTWLQELHFMHDDLLNSLKTTLPEAQVEDIRFRLDTKIFST